MKPLWGLLGLVACHSTRPPEPAPQTPTPDTIGLAPRPDPTTCVVSRAFFGSDDPWIIGCPAEPEPVPIGARPCEIHDGARVVYQLDYDADGRPVQIRSALSGDQTFDWADGRLTAVHTSIGTFAVRSEGEWTTFALPDGVNRRFRSVNGRLAAYEANLDATVGLKVQFVETPDTRVSRTPISGLRASGPGDEARQVATFAEGRVQSVSYGGAGTTWVYEDGRPVRTESAERVVEILYTCPASP